MATWDGESGAYAARKRLNKMSLDGNFSFEIRKTKGEGSTLYGRFNNSKRSVPIPRP